MTTPDSYDTRWAEMRLLLEALIATWRERASEMDDGSGVTLCADLADHYRNRADELETVLAGRA